MRSNGNNNNDNNESKSLLANDEFAEQQREVADNKDCLGQMPPDVMVLIMSKMSIYDLAALSQVSRRYQGLAQKLNIFYEPLTITHDEEGKSLSGPITGYVSGTYDQVHTFFKEHHQQKRRIAAMDNECCMDKRERLDCVASYTFAGGLTTGLVSILVGTPMAMFGVVSLTTCAATSGGTFMATFAGGGTGMLIARRLANRAAQRDQLRADFGRAPTEAKLSGAKYNLNLPEGVKPCEGPPKRRSMQ